MWPLRKMGNAFAEGAVESGRGRIVDLVSRPVLPVVVPALAAPAGAAPAGAVPAVAVPPSMVEQFTKESLIAFINALAESFQRPAGSTGDPPGVAAIKNITQRLTELLQEEGELKKALGESFTMLNKFITQEDGEIKKFIDELKKLLTEHMKDVVDEVLKSTDKGVDEIGETVSKKYTKMVGISVIAGVVMFTAIYGLKLVWGQIEQSLKTPKLITESSKKSLWQKIKGYFHPVEIVVPEMVLPADLKRRLDTIAAVTRATRIKISHGQTNVKYRNLLLWGPPGTGKTMFAEILALTSGMEFAKMSGASFAKYVDGQGIIEMDKLFEWAELSENGLLVFIDECESFLGGRMGSDVTKDAYQLVNNFLNHTGKRSDKFMFVLATNHPMHLDKAVMRRVDDSVEMLLPGELERAKILRLYRDKLLLDSKHNNPEFIESVQRYLLDDDILEIAQKTDKLSGSELEGIANAILTDSLVTANGLVTKELVWWVVGQAVTKNREFEEGFEKEYPL